MKNLRELTMARVALGRTGNSLPLRPMLEFQLAHARARDAVHYPFRANIIPGAIIVQSAAKDRNEYLRRPDLGRKLAPDIVLTRAGYDAVFVMCDGLSPLAVERHGPALLNAVMSKLGGWNLAPVIVCERDRVAIADEIGERLGAALSVVLIGERPGLSSPDSLGVYQTWSPRIGRTDADRNCISNIRPEGLAIGPAAELLALLMTQARSRQLSGIHLKPPLYLSTGPCS
ncbi:MAG: ethanolamine ammonia-lyase subunit EutC [Acidobacteriota bacterium]|nr:ethanolamine ammonia-lyase subunit EutC [Acidobacteriota bacterium]